VGMEDHNKVWVCEISFSTGVNRPIQVTILHIPISFPSDSDKIHEEAVEFRRLSSTERFRQIFGLSAFGELLLKQSPNRDQILALRLASEHEWQRIHRELFLRHGV
jgi:hypothetical protein